MTKDLLIKEVAERATDIMAAMVTDENTVVKKFTKKEVNALLQAYTECVVDNLVDNKDEKIPLPGIGNFTAKHVDARDGVSAINGKEWHKDAEDQLVFKVSKSVKTLA